MRHPFRTVLAVLALAALPALAQDVYKIDPVHSEASFKVRLALGERVEPAFWATIWRVISSMTG